MSKVYTIARINIGSKNFELIVKPEPALSYREKKSTSLSNALVSETVFSDANKGLRVSEKDLREAFGTIDIQKIAHMILIKGNLQLTTEQRKRMIEEKRRQIITFISRQAVNPKTKTPHPPMRIQNALEQIRFKVDPLINIEEQANEAISQIRHILPISIETISVSVRIPPNYTGKVYGTVKSFGEVKNESWKNDGSWFGIVRMPAGRYGPFLSKLGDMTRGNIEVELIK